MSSSYWITKKTLQNKDYKVEFQWFMEDMRDIMSDSLKPQMERNPDRNRIQVYELDSGVPRMTVSVPASIGNECYKKLKAVDTGWEDILDAVYLSVCVYYDDYDAYSDNFKDLYGVRPHYTKREWDDMVYLARNS